MQQSKKAIKESARIKREKAKRRKEYNEGAMAAWEGFFRRIEKERKTYFSGDG